MKHKVRIIFQIAGFSFWIITFCAPEIRSEPVTFESQIDNIFKPYHRQDNPGVSVGIIQNGEIVYAKGWGMANLEHSIPITPDSVFDIASVSKQFAGFGIALLEAEGKLTLNDRIRDHVHGLPEVFAPIRLSHLLYHTSGIRDWPGAFVLGGKRFDDVITFDEILSLARRQEALSFTHGSNYSYSNTGYNLLAHSVETITGEDFSDWMKERVFKPLDMHDTHFHKNHTRIVKNRVHSYAGARGGPFRNVGNQLTALGSSSLYSSVNDLLKWILHMQHPTLLSPSALKKNMTPGTLNNGKSTGYAYGFGVSEKFGLKRISHSGSWAGFRTFLVYFPEESSGIVILSNWSQTNASGLASKVALVLLKDKLEGTLPKTNSINFSDLKPIPSNPEETKAWVGQYQWTQKKDKTVVWSIQDGIPSITLPDDMPIELQQSSSNTFFNASKKTLVQTSQGVNQWPGILEIKSPSWNGKAEEKPQKTFDPEELSDYEGVYYSSELLAEYRIVEDKNTLKVIHHRHDPVKLSRFGRDRFKSDTWFLSKIDFDRSSEGRVTGLRVTQSRNRNMQFLKR